MFGIPRVWRLSILGWMIVLWSGCAVPWPPDAADPPASPVLFPEEAIETLVVPPGFRVELVASEPLVEDPVAMDFDPDGRLYVVEMRAWMRDIDGHGSLEPIGAVAVLEDADQDGRMDRRTVFVDSLVNPNAVKVLSDGVLIGEPNNLWFVRDTDGNLEADEKTLVSDRFGIRKANMEANANGLVWGLDNWIHTTDHDRRYRRENGSWVADSTLKVGQFGLTMDDYGRMYRNNNTQPVQTDYLDPYYYARNPNLSRPDGADAALAEDLEVWPIRATRGANRGYQESALRADGTLRTFTAACGPGVYRGGAYPAEFTEKVNVFVPEPVGNLVHRYVIGDREDGTRAAVPAYERASFLTSTDERFRPVNSMTGPDGALYVVDMYRGIIEHRDFITTYLRRHIQARNLDEPIGLGRIYRVVYEDAERRRPPRLSSATTEQLVEHLRDDNGWWRDTAQRLLVEGGRTSAVPALQEMVGNEDVRTRIHALWTLHGLGGLTPEIVRQALRNGSPHVRAAAVRMAERWLRSGSAELAEPLAELVDDPSAVVRLQLAAAIGEADPDVAEPIQTALLKEHAGQPFLVEGVISGLHDREPAILKRLMRDDSWKDDEQARVEAVRTLAAAVIRGGDAEAIDDMLARIADDGSPKWQRMAVLEGVESVIPGGQGVVLPLELPARPGSLDRIVNAGDPAVREKAREIADRLTWPGKPGSGGRVELLAPAARSRFEQGREIYAMQCATCHGESGEGERGLAVPLAGSEWVNGGHYNLVRILLQGKEGDLGLMPPQQNLSDEDMADVLTFVRNAWGNAAYPVTPAQVADLRLETAARERPWTEEELEATVH